MRSLRLLWTFFALIFSLPVQAATLETFAIAGWSGAAISDDRTGQLSHCAILRNYPDGAALVFIIDSKLHHSISFANDAWHLREGTPFPLSYAINDGAAISAAGQILQPDTVGVALADNLNVFEQFKDGDQLRLNAAGHTFLFDLKGISKALNAAQLCANKWTMGGNAFRVPDPVTKAPPQQNISTPHANAAEANAFISNWMSGSDVTGFTLMAPQDAAKNFPQYDAAWTLRGTVGGFVVTPDDSSRQVARVFASIASIDAEDCMGKFTSLLQPIDARARPFLLGRLMTACVTNGTGYAVYYSLLARPKGGTYLIVVAGTENGPDDTDAGKADVDIMNAVYRGMSSTSISQ
jgi:hypothetical protein